MKSEFPGDDEHSLELACQAASYSIRTYLGSEAAGRFRDGSISQRQVVLYEMLDVMVDMDVRTITFDRAARSYTRAQVALERLDRFLNPPQPDPELEEAA